MRKREVQRDREEEIGREEEREKRGRDEVY